MPLTTIVSQDAAIAAPMPRTEAQDLGADIPQAPEHGSPPIGRKRGRPVSTSLAAYRQVFPEWSERTIARFDVSMRRLRVMGYTLDERVATVARCTRANGTVRVAYCDALTESMAAMWVIKRQDAKARR